MRTFKLLSAIFLVAVLSFSCSEDEADVDLYPDGTITLTTESLTAGGDFFSKLPPVDYWYLETDDINSLQSKIFTHLRQIYDEQPTRRITIDCTNSTFTAMDTYFFYYSTDKTPCYALESFIAPSTSCTAVPNYCFYMCENLKYVKFPRATSIGTYSFRYCYGLEEIDFPAASTIGSRAFQDCTSLKTVKFLCSTTQIKLNNNNPFQTSTASNDELLTENIDLYLSSGLNGDCATGIYWATYNSSSVAIDTFWNSISIIK